MNVRATLLVSALLIVFAVVLGISWLAVIGVVLLIVGLVAAVFQSDDRRECPYCREQMRRDATVCPHCRHDVEPAGA